MIFLINCFNNIVILPKKLKNKEMYIIEFIIVQTCCVFYLRYLFKNKITSGSVSAFGAILLLELLAMYNLWVHQSVLENLFNYIF